MKTAPVPVNEAERLAALRDLNVLDTEPELAFYALVHVASLVCQVPVSLISLVDGGRQWFKANIGLPGVSETPRDIAFCSHAILDDALFEVPDARQDSRFADNPLVTSAPDIRFYAGAPIRLSDGNRVGTLCVIDREPRHLTDTQRSILRYLAAASAAALEGRRAIQVRQQGLQDLRESEARFRTLSESSPFGVYYTNAQGEYGYTNHQWQQIHGRDLLASLGHRWMDAVHPEDRDKVVECWDNTVTNGREFALEFRIVREDASTRRVLSRARPTLDDAGQITSFIGAIEDLTEHYHMLERVAASELALHREKQRLENILEGTQAATWEWNVQTGEVRFNARWAEIIGYTLGQLSPLSIQTWINHVEPDDLARSEAQLGKHFSGEADFYECEVRMLHRDDYFVWVQARGRVLTWTFDGKPEWMFGMQQDVSERKRKEEVRRKNEGFLNRTGKVAGTGGWEVDLRKGEITWSDETCRIHGVPPGYRPRMDEALEFYPLEARQTVTDALDASMTIGEVVGEQGAKGTRDPWDLELPFIRRDGSQIWVRVVGSVEFENDQAVRIVGAIQDITERHRLTLELAAQHELLRITLQCIGDGVITTDAWGNIVWMNPVAEQLTGWSTEDAHGQSLREVFHVVNTHTREVIDNPATVCLREKYVGMPHDTTLISREGVEYGIQESASPMQSESGEVLGVVIVFHDVTEQRKMTGEMRFRATHDALTGLINRSEFESRLARLLHTAHNEQTENALLYIDLDQFKIVNDSCGHAVGDQLLIQVSKMLGESVRARDTCARLGGDEFAILLERCPLAQAQRVAQQVCDRMEEFRFVHDDRRFRVGTSIGLVPVDQRWITPEAIMQAADTACYAAKEGGRNRVHVWFDSDATVAARHGEMQWTTRIEQALDEDEFVLHGQRIKALSDAPAGLHAEVLVRMKNADGSLILPNAFLPAAERFQLASRIDKLVLRRTLDWMLRISSVQCIENISINLSGKSVGDRAFHHWAIEQLQGAGVEICTRLSIELTETAAVTNLTDAVTFIKRVRALGVRVALDDFGSGASSFGYLKTMPVDLLKIDGQFVRDLATDPLDEAAVQSFANVAKVIGVKTVAKYVESSAILAKVTEIGIDFAQGFYLFEPEPLDRMLARYLGE